MNLRLTIIFSVISHLIFGQELENKEYYDNGNLHIEYSGKPDKPHGQLNGYFESGELQFSGEYTSGLQNGITKQFYKSGKVNQTMYFKDGIMDSSFFNYENGQLWEVNNFKNGKKHGSYKMYFDNGQLMIKGTHKNNKYDGHFIFYDSTGTKESEGIYNKGKTVGAWYFNDIKGGEIKQFYQTRNITISDSLQNVNINYIIAFQTTILTKDKNNQAALLKRSFYNQQIGNHNDAIKDLDILIKLTPFDYRAINSRALSKGRINDIEGAILDYTKAIEIKSDFVDAYYGRALLYRKLLEFDLSIQDVDKVILLNIDNPSLGRRFIFATWIQ